MRRYVLEIVIPVHNEERDLPACLQRLHEYLSSEVPYRTRIVVADNASTDDTLGVARRLSAELPTSTSSTSTPKGRGGALAAAWRARRPTWWPTWTSTSPPTCPR